MKRLFEVMLLALSIVALLGCEPQYDHDQADTPANKAGFERHFGFSPPASVTDLYYWADGMGADVKYQLGFKADQSTIDQIVTELQLEDKELDSSSFFGRDFDWWKMDEIQSLPVFWKQVEDKEYYRYLWYDAESRRAYFLEFSV